jgi:hypothetical protein
MGLPTVAGHGVLYNYKRGCAPLEKLIADKILYNENSFVANRFGFRRYNIQWTIQR